MKKKILFIINPISGGKSKKGFPQAVKHYLDQEKFSADFVFTEFSGHAIKAAEEGVMAGSEIIVAVGGDGTINEIASILEGTNFAMGIVPFGSGNGLARSLGIPLVQNDAIARLNQATVVRIDTAMLNKRKFFNIAGMGFDAQISNRFANHQTRGLTGYIRTTFSEVTNYEPQNYQVEIDGSVLERKAFMISIANSSQFGNNAHISPTASLTDGLLDVCIIRPFPLYHLPMMGYHMFSNTTDQSRYVEIIKGRSIKITRETDGPIHLDGEPVFMNREISIVVNPLSLSILV